MASWRPGVVALASPTTTAPRAASAAPDAERLLLRACVLSLVAGFVHAIVTPDHFAEWWGYGLFFILAAFVQAGYGAIPLFRRMVEGEGILTGWAPNKVRAFVWVGIVGNAATILLWLVTRTFGIPFVGPEAGRVESVGFWDSLSKLVEVALVVTLAMLLRRVGRARDAQRAPV